MDDLDRLFQRLVHNIRNGHAEYLSVPFTVQELYDTLVPYRHYRRDLGIETNQDYEAAVTRLLSGEKGYVRADKAMQDRLKKEMESPHADVGAFRDYAETRISLHRKLVILHRLFQIARPPIPQHQCRAGLCG